MTSPRPAPTGDEPVVHSCWNGRVVGRYSHDGYTVVWAHGEIDMATAPDLMQELAEAVCAHPCRVIVDLTQVTFMDSTGFSALVRARADAGNGELRLVGASGMLCEVLRVTGLEEVFPVHSTIEESIGQGPPAQHNGTVTQDSAQAEFRG
jgi:anti-sigma B factor antagonist